MAFPTLKIKYSHKTCHLLSSDSNCSCTLMSNFYVNSPTWYTKNFQLQAGIIPFNGIFVIAFPILSNVRTRDSRRFILIKWESFSFEFRFELGMSRTIWDFKSLGIFLKSRNEWNLFFCILSERLKKYIQIRGSWT